jgi:pimeloyl-ACP methyl ester carboxylesterase
VQGGPHRPSSSIGFGTNGTSIPSAGGTASSATGATSVVCCGVYSLRTGASTTQPLRRQLQVSTIPFRRGNINSYRHRYGNAAGDPAFDKLEERLAARPAIAIPTIVLHGAEDGVAPPVTSEGAARHFTGTYERRLISLAGHFISRETPEAVIQAVRDLL